MLSSFLNTMHFLLCGPDDAGILFHPDEGIGLAQRRLSIIDLSPLGHQPM
jgi:asparagine synthase (glutamine-hydrolysing)